MNKLTKNADIAESINALKTLLGEEPTPSTVAVHCILRHCARSGMMRDISLLFISKTGQISNITWHAAKVMGVPVVQRDGHNAIRVTGAGMDMGFHIVYRLSRALYRDDTDPRQVDDPGYMLRAEWL